MEGTGGGEKWTAVEIRGPVGGGLTRRIVYEAERKQASVKSTRERDAPNANEE